MTIFTIILAAIGVILVFIIATSIIASIFFNRSIRHEAAHLFQDRKQTKKELITEEDIEGLPEPLQRYLMFTQIIGEKKVSSVRLKQKGEIRTRVNQNFMAFDADQYYTVDPPGFIWHVNLKPAVGVNIIGIDKFMHGKGGMNMKLLSLFKIVDAEGDEMNQGALLRFFTEMLWFPSAFLSDYITWEEIDKNSVKGTIILEGISASAELFIKDNGEANYFTAERYKEVDGSFSLEKWATPIREYQELNGIKVPLNAEAVWHLKEGQFSYFRAQVTSIEYDIPEVY